MRKWLLLLALVVFPTGAWASTQSTINPLLPVQGAPLTSAPVRNNFQAAYNDINNIYSLLPGTIGTITTVTCNPTAPFTCSITPSGSSVQINIGGTFQGSGNKIQLSTGSTTTNDCVKFDSSGNVIDAGIVCGGGTPGGSSAQIQYNNAGAFGGFTASGDATIVTSTGVVTVAKVNGVSYGTSPSTNTVPVVTGANTVTYETVPNAALANNAIIFGATSQALGSTVTNLNAVNVGPTTAGTGAFTTLSGSSTITFSGISGSTQCLHVNSSGTVTGTGSDCGTGSGAVTSVSGTAGQVTASPTTGAVVVGLPATITANETFSGSTTHSGSVLFTSTVPSLVNGNAAVAASATLGGLFTGQGSTDDITFQNKSGTTICTAATGTTTLNCTGLQVGGVAVSTTTGTVTSVATTAPITGGAITSTGTIACPTCATTTNGGALSGTAPIAVSVAGVISGGGLGTVTGALKGNGSGTITQAACADLSNGTTGCSTATGTSGATLEVNNANNTVSGNNTYSGTSLFTGANFTVASNGQATVGASSTNGAIFEGQGSVNDIIFQNKSGTSICAAATGTTTLNCTGLQVGGTSVLTGNQTITLSGDTTGSGTTAITTATVKVNGGAIPTSATALASNSSNQIIAATLQGNGAKVQLSTGTTTTNDCVKFDANGNTIDAGAACGSGGSTPGYVTQAAVATERAQQMGSMNTPDQEAWSGLIARVNKANVFLKNQTFSGGITATLNLGTSASATNPQRSGQATTGLYSDTTNVVDIGANSQPVSVFTGVASAVDYINWTNAATANPATITGAATGSDGNINVAVTPKGTGQLQVSSTGNNGAQLLVTTAGQAGAEFKNTATGGNDWFLKSDDNGQSPAGCIEWFNASSNGTPIAFCGGNGFAKFTMSSQGVYGWSNQSQYTNVTLDTGMSRDAAGVFDFGNGTQGDKTAKLQANAYQVVGSGKANVNAALAAVMMANFGGL
jgi:hypothetical protein